MAVHFVAEENFVVGAEAALEGASPLGRYSVVFEDDTQTGYFYALDLERGDNAICDALHIYDVASITDKHVPSLFQIVWSEDGLKTALLIDDQPHAIVDFESKRAYCVSGFPPPNLNWTSHSHEWDESAIDLFR